MTGILLPHHSHILPGVLGRGRVCGSHRWQPTTLRCFLATHHLSYQHVCGRTVGFSFHGLCACASCFVCNTTLLETWSEDHTINWYTYSTQYQYVSCVLQWYQVSICARPHTHALLGETKHHGWDHQQWLGHVQNTTQQSNRLKY